MSSFLKARQTKYAAYATVYILVVLAVIAIVNVLANRYEKSYDATANKRYSLSEQTAKIVKGLKQDAKITYFNRSTRFEDGRDLLGQYADLSHKLHIEYSDPEKDPLVARQAGIHSIPTAVVEIGDKKAEAKSMDEQGITGAFIRDLKNTVRTVCFVGGSGERQIDDTTDDGFSKFKDFLGKDDYTAKSINLLQQASVPAECTVVVIGGPHSNYLQPEVTAIQNYVQGGGRALVMLDPPLKMGHTDIADNDALDKVLEDWGVTPKKDLILDFNPLGQLAGLGPQVALVTSYESQPIVNEMKGTATGFPLARSLEIKNADKTSVDKLFNSSSTSLATDKLNSPRIDPNDPQNVKGPLLLAAAGTYTTGKENSQGRFVVVGCSMWAANSFITFNGNSDLALNTVNWLASDEDLISIRPKAPEDRRITMTSAQMRWVIITSQFLLPLIVIFVGIAVWWRRR